MTIEIHKIACIGECMLELSPAGENLLHQDFAGDTYNTAVYFKRQFGEDVDVSYITALGNDGLSTGMIKQFQAEGIETRSVRIIPNGQPGLYLIENDEKGDRSFQYWRSTSAARSLFKGMDSQDIYNLLQSFDLIYLSGITLAILNEEQRTPLLGALGKLKDKALIAFDPNFRPALWPNIEECRQAFKQIANVSSIVLSTFDDDQAIWGEQEISSAAQRWRKWGVPQVVIKNGEEGCSIFTEHEAIQVPPPKKIAPLDTTGAGDSFCAGYLGAILKGTNLNQAAFLGHQIAAQIIQHPGGVISPSVWSPVKQDF